MIMFLFAAEIIRKRSIFLRTYIRKRPTIRFYAIQTQGCFEYVYYISFPGLVIPYLQGNVKVIDGPNSNSTINLATCFQKTDYVVRVGIFVFCFHKIIIYVGVRH